jgi:hypothetical protein
VQAGAARVRVWRGRQARADARGSAALGPAGRLASQRRHVGGPCGGRQAAPHASACPTCGHQHVSARHVTVADVSDVPARGGERQQQLAAVLWAARRAGARRRRQRRRRRRGPTCPDRRAAPVRAAAPPAAAPPAAPAGRRPQHARRTARSKRHSTGRTLGRLSHRSSLGRGKGPNAWAQQVGRGGLGAQASHHPAPAACLPPARPPPPPHRRSQATACGWACRAPGRPAQAPAASG